MTEIKLDILIDEEQHDKLSRQFDSVLDDCSCAESMTSEIIFDILNDFGINIEKIEE